MARLAQVRVAAALLALGALAAVACGGKIAPAPDDGTSSSSSSSSSGHVCDLCDPLNPYPSATTTAYPRPTPNPNPRPPATTSSSSSGDPAIGPPPAFYDAGTELPQPGPAVLVPETSWTWKAYSFTYDRTLGMCWGGQRYVRQSTRFGLWVGVELCSPTRYKIYLGASLTEDFHEIADWAGNGQDHCELVNPSFTIPNEDDITSGCPSCNIGPFSWTWPGAVPVYSRGYFGTPFDLGTWPANNYYTPEWYECGVSIP